MAEKIRIADRQPTPFEIAAKMAMGQKELGDAVFDIEALKGMAHRNIDELFKKQEGNGKIAGNTYTTYFANLPRQKGLDVEQRKQLMYEAACMKELATTVFPEGSIPVGVELAKQRIDDFFEKRASQDINTDGKVDGKEIKVPTKITAEILNSALNKIGNELRIIAQDAKPGEAVKKITPEDRKKLFADVQAKAGEDKEYSLGDIKAVLTDFRASYGLKPLENGR